MSNVFIVVSLRSKRYDKKPRRGSTNAMPNRLAWTGTLPRRMPAFGSNASTHNFKT